MRKVEKLSFFPTICQRLSHNKLITTFEQYLHGFNDDPERDLEIRTIILLDKSRARFR